MRLVLRRDRDRVFRFAPLDSAAGRGLRLDHGLPTGDGNTVVVVTGGRALVRSDAVLAVFAALPWPWRALRWTAFIPRPVRDASYDFVARRRFRLRRRLAACPLPPPADRDRFLD